MKKIGLSALAIVLVGVLVGCGKQEATVAPATVQSVEPAPAPVEVPSAPVAPVVEAPASAEAPVTPASGENVKVEGAPDATVQVSTDKDGTVSATVDGVKVDVPADKGVEVKAGDLKVEVK